MVDFIIKPTDVFEIVSKQKKRIAISFAATFLLVMVVFVIIPRSYKAEAVVHIGVTYFQNPLIGDLISQTHDPGELRAERERIIKTSLGVDFANKMGEKYGLFKTKANDLDRAVEVETFLKSLDVSPITTTQFAIKYKGKSAKIVDGIIHDAIDAIREYMYVHRVQLLEEFFTVLQDEIASTNGAPVVPGDVSHFSSVAKANADRSQISAQIQVLRKRLEDLQHAYNEQHPSIQAVKAEISELESIEKSDNLSSHLSRKRSARIGSNHNSQATTLIRDDLSKQGHLVNISLELEKKDPTMSAYVSLVKEPVYPKTPVFPKFRIFLLLAVIFAVIISTLTAAFAEFWYNVALGPKEASKRLKLEYLGSLVLNQSDRT